MLSSPDAKREGLLARSNQEWSVLYAADGKPVGSIAFRGRSYHYVDESKKVAVEFLAKITKQTKGNEMSTSERVNMVLLAGVVQFIEHREDKIFFTLDTNQKQWIPCSIYKQPELQTRARGLANGDFIQLRAILVAWSKKNEMDDKWNRGLNVEVTEIKNIVKGSPTQAKEEKKRDSLPF